MGKKLHIDQAAEKEATDIGAKFMHSSDVVGDMSRAYGRDLSSVRIHTDESAARGAAERGVDAFSTGKDVFFGRGAFDRSAPASRGLLAHELNHSRQQGVGGEGGAMAQSAPMGTAQGGLLDWFRSKFGKKKKPEPEPEPEMEISEPELVTGPIREHTTNDKGDVAVRTFQNSRSHALNQMLQGATREQLQNPMLRRLVIEDYNTNMNSRLRSLNSLSKTQMDSEAFRNGAGELNNLNIMLSSMLPEDFDQQVMSAQKTGGLDAATQFIGDSVEGNTDVMDFIGALAPSFEGVDNYADPEARSTMMMNNLLLRTVNGEVAKRYGMAQRARANVLKKQGKNNAEISADIAKTVDNGDVMRSMKLQKEFNTGKSAGASRLRNLFLNRLRGGH